MHICVSLALFAWLGDDRYFMHIFVSLARVSCLWRGTSIWSQMVLTGASLARRSHLDPKGGGHVLLTGLGAEK